MPKFGLRTLLACFIGLAAILAIACPAILQVREAARRVTCGNQIRQMALGLHNYESAFGRLPIGIEIKPDGTLYSSWRVSVAPFLESAQQFYDPKFAWNSPQNARLYDGSTVIATNKGGGNPTPVVLDPCHPWRWCCSSDSTKRVNYAVVVGEETAFPPNRAVAFNEITDGLENTILIVETLSGSSIWTEPRDIQFDSMKFVLGNSENGELASKHKDGVNVAFADGEVYFLAKSITPDELRALLTISGGESIKRQDLLDRGILQ